MTAISANLIVYRHPEMNVGDEFLKKKCEDLSLVTSYNLYNKPSRKEDAPGSTDCLTAVAYLLGQISDKVRIKSIVLEKLDLIRNMPTRMQNLGWDRKPLSIVELKSGDILFLKKRAKNNLLVTHVAMALSSEEVFHSSLENSGGRIEKITELFEKYAPYDRASPLLNCYDDSISYAEMPVVPTLSSDPLQGHKKSAVSSLFSDSLQDNKMSETPSLFSDPLQFSKLSCAHLPIPIPRRGSRIPLIPRSPFSPSSGSSSSGSSSSSNSPPERGFSSHSLRKSVSDLSTSRSLPSGSNTPPNFLPPSSLNGSSLSTDTTRSNSPAESSQDSSKENPTFHSFEKSSSGSLNSGSSSGAYNSSLAFFSFPSATTRDGSPAGF